MTTREVVASIVGLKSGRNKMNNREIITITINTLAKTVHR